MNLSEGRSDACERPMPAPAMAAMTPRRLLHVFSSFAVGGSQVRFCRLIDRFAADDTLDHVHHDVVAMDGDLACRNRLPPDAPVGFPQIALTKGDTLRTVVRLRAALRRYRPDVLVTYNWGAIEWAMANALVRCRHIHVEDGFGPEERDQQIARRVWTRRLFLRRSTVVLPSLTLTRIANAIWRLPGHAIVYVPNGVDLALFTNSSGRNQERLVIGSVGALRPEKNVGRLLDAFAALPPMAAGLVIAGDGPERTKLERRAAELGIADRVRFLGHVARPAEVYRELDIVAVPSDTEQMPLTVLEAMASGLPLVATDVGDIRAMVAPANHPYVVERNAGSMAAALATLARDPDARRRVGQANLERVKAEYDEAVMVRRWSSLFAATR